jgi:hypothetical protein
MDTFSNLAATPINAKSRVLPEIKRTSRFGHLIQIQQRDSKFETLIDSLLSFGRS